jgi:hypothetical protein
MISKIKRLEKKIEEEKDDLKKELWKIDLDEKVYAKANMELTAKDRMRELKMWSKLKKEFNDGTFDTQDVNKHQLDSYAKIMQNKAKTLTDGSSQPEVFNVLGQLKTIERVQRDGELDYQKREAISTEQELWKKIQLIKDNLPFIKRSNTKLNR